MMPFLSQDQFQFNIHRDVLTAKTSEVQSDLKRCFFIGQCADLQTPFSVDVVYGLKGSIGFFAADAVGTLDHGQIAVHRHIIRD